MTITDELIAELQCLREESADDTADSLNTEHWEPIAREGGYEAYAKDLDFLWRWIIVRNGQVVQEGCSISLTTAIRSVRHVLAFFNATEAGRSSLGQGTSVPTAN